jgi:hypothetical protein
MSLVATLGRGAASGLAGALAWVAASVLILGAPSPRRAALVGLGIGLAVVAVTAVARLR